MTTLRQYQSVFRLRGMTPATLTRAYLASRRPLPSPTHVFLCVADHFEPDWRMASPAQQRARVARWVQHYGAAVDGLRDSRGQSPQHTFFYPVEVYREELLEELATLVRSGHGDIEVHLHHDDDHAEALRELLLSSVERMHSLHGLFTKDDEGRIRYGFVHGNWALDNSRPDGRWCGVNNELTILRETGCYADFTMPSAPDAAQTKTINSIYYAVDDPQRPKSHDVGLAASRNEPAPADGLLMIQGPLLIRHRKPRCRVKLENGNIAGSQPPAADRIEDWLRAQVCVQGHEQWLFVKLHTHGAQEKNADVLLGPVMRRFHEQLRSLAHQRNFEFFYVTAREMAQLVAQAEQGAEIPMFDELAWSPPVPNQRSPE